MTNLATPDDPDDPDEHTVNAPSRRAAAFTPTDPSPVLRPPFFCELNYSTSLERSILGRPMSVAVAAIEEAASHRFRRTVYLERPYINAIEHIERMRNADKLVTLEQMLPNATPEQILTLRCLWALHEPAPPPPVSLTARARSFTRRLPPGAQFYAEFIEDTLKVDSRTWSPLLQSLGWVRGRDERAGMRRRRVWFAPGDPLPKPRVEPS
jgi:hypothetical protein